MKAVVCREPYSLGIEDRPPPAAGPGDVLIRIRRVGLCGTDYHIFTGRHPFLAYPRVMGHELSGEVAHARPDSAFHVGQTVAINPYLACGTCVACRKGKPNACMNISVLGVHADGGMTEFVAVPESAVIDASGLTIDQAAMLEFLAIGAHAVSRAHVSSTDRVLVVGAGPIGIAAGLFARLCGADVTLVDTRASRLAYARERLGFETTVEAGPDLGADLASRTDDEMFDIVFDATGSLAAMAQSLHYVAHGGALVLVGVAPGDLVFPDPEFHKRETTLIASRNALAADFEQVKHAIQHDLIPTDALHTHSLSAEEMPTRLPELIAGADHVLKAIATF
ncbi:zinc-binding alcohol dehydrogenase family protein [Sphingobium sp. BYY-5]|uniref:zinc-binding alcohol dehydrogenase family protein n=1 Tax=Sphingobium sp. BYY-5 TaxID=2926400 RepID=UPI001FA7CDBD|nr:zinc-binding alcohol dehydrogenase family protein [Sphingobium sp. BYY-5]MCI4588948.1 zinc-binding alcohol dehydrogenase family protein [Sphingobium sp. BYY-5]